MPLDSRSRVTPRLLFGAALFVFGLLLLLGNLELLELDYALHFFWPSAFVLIGLGQLFFGRTWYWGAVWVVAGGWLFLDELGLSPVSFWEILLPAVLVLLGISMVMRSLRGPRPRPERPDEGEVVSAFAFMAGNKRRLVTAGFRGGDLTAVMGGCELDLRECGLAMEGATIDCFAFWGGIEIRIPPEWALVSKVLPLMGGFEDKTQPPKGEGGPRLVVRGFAIMGGIEVKN